MKNLLKILALILLTLILIGCTHSFPEYTEPNQKEHAEKTFGYQFDKNHNWCTTINGYITVTPLAGTKTIQVLVYSGDNEGEATLKVLNSVNGDKTVTLWYDTPSSYLGLYVACITEDGYYTLKQFKEEDGKVDFKSESLSTRSAKTRGTTTEPDLTIDGSSLPFERTRGYEGFENEVMYYTNQSTSFSVPDYGDEFKGILRSFISTYIPRGKQYDNLQKIRESGLYNENCYATTNGLDPVTVSLVYKNDGGSHEVEKCDLYYFYFKDPNITLQGIKDLPKYKLVKFSETMKGDDVIEKHLSYKLVYWGDGVPEAGVTKGTYNFPEGYKIGFMVQSNNGDRNKRGELHFDGRLNKDINQHGFYVGANLGIDDPRMCWISFNNKIFFCGELGCDRNFKEIVVEVEGIKPITTPLNPDNNFYTFCFEDTKQGDYDMNDIVISGERLDNTHVRYILMAAGANDELYLNGVDGSVINQNTEVHEIFGDTGRGFINTETKNYPYIEDIVTVSQDFSFLKFECQPYLENRTRGYNIYVSLAGEDPHGIMIPYAMSWPRERIRIDKAYPEFRNWGQNMIESTDWYLLPVEDLVINP